MNTPPPTTRGALADVPVYLRWENTDPPHRKFYEVEVELSLFFPKRLTRRWGRIGTRQQRSTQVVMATANDLLRVVAQVDRIRHHHGYHRVSA